MYYDLLSKLSEEKKFSERYFCFIKVYVNKLNRHLTFHLNLALTFSICQLWLSD